MSLTVVAILTSIIEADGVKEAEKPVVVAWSEESWLNKFIQEFFSTDEMVFTLFGSKPMAGRTICLATEEESQRVYEQLIKGFTEDKKLEVYKNLHEYYEDFDLDVNFNKWMERRKKDRLSPFLFRSTYSENKKYIHIEMINIREAAWTLEKNYAVFQREVGTAFNPVEVVMDFENPDSPFWKKALTNHYLLGILYGFGERNAYFFSARHNYKEERGITKEQHPLFATEPDIYLRHGFNEDGSIEYLAVPGFKSFKVALGEDPVVSQFKKEREVIIEQLRGKNFVEEVLKKFNH